jgi:xylose isomerase
MAKPKLSVILPNYSTPHDRFSSYGGTKKDTIAMIQTCGKQGVAQGVELLMGDSSVCVNDGNKKAVRAAMKDNNLQTVAILPITYSEDFYKGSLGAADAKTRKNAIDLVKKAIDLAAELDCPYVGQWPGQDGWDYYFEVDYQKTYEWWVKGMQELADYNPKIRLGLEPKPFEPRSFSFIDTPAKVMMLARDIGRENVGLTLDIGHSLYGHENLAAVVALAQREKKLFHLHINDNYADSDGDMAFGSVHFLGSVEFVYWLVRTNYQGWHSVDIFPYRTDPAQTVLESLKWMQAMYDFVEKIGLEKLDALIKQGDGMAMMSFFREILFGAK